MSLPFAAVSIDIFPVSSPDPFRIEIWGDDIESIRTYDPIGQKSTGSADRVDLTPAQELELLEQSESLCSILEYLGPNTLVICDELLDLEDRYANLVSLCERPNRAFSTIDAFLDEIEPLQKIFWTSTPVEQLS